MDQAAMNVMAAVTVKGFVTRPFASVLSRRTTRLQDGQKDVGSGNQEIDAGSARWQGCRMIRVPDLTSDFHAIHAFRNLWAKWWWGWGWGW